MKNLGILAIAAVTALVLGVASFGTKTAQAEVTDTRAVSCVMILVLGEVDCTDGLSSAELVDLDENVGDDDGQLEPSDLDDIDVDANQLNGNGNDLDTYVFAFVDDDEEVTFDAQTGVVVVVNVDTTGADSPNTDLNAEVCTAEDDADCDSDDVDDGDGVVVARIEDGTADPGDEVEVEVSQADDTNAISTETLSIVGDPDNITVSQPVEKVIQTSGEAPGGDCDDEADNTDAGQLADVEKTFVQAVVTDNDDVPLTGVVVTFESDDDDIAFVADPGDGGADQDSLSVDAGDSGVAAFVVVCGGDTTGTATITGLFDFIEEEDDSTEITVVGEPASIALTASPAGIVCDGSTSSTVTATVTDSEGNNVAGGTNVNFSVVALGVANPINFGTVDGQASSQITPLAGALAGVTVIVTSGEAQSSILVGCNTPGAEGTPIAPVPTPTSGTGVTPPDTGNGGYLGQDSSSSFPMWTLIALALGAVALVGGGAIARRAAK